MMVSEQARLAISSTRRGGYGLRSVVIGCAAVKHTVQIDYRALLVGPRVDI